MQNLQPRANKHLEVSTVDVIREMDFKNRIALAKMQLDALEKAYTCFERESVTMKALEALEKTIYSIKRTVEPEDRK